MARQQRKSAKRKPVTQHLLFPAVVALWFGALFGLGSLAVRPSLLEGLVIKSRIDLLIPAAAPPLGMTARMLVALCMAVLGAMIGAALARRIARPRQEVRERKRTTLSTRDEGADYRPYSGHAEASTQNPGPAVQAVSDASTAATPGIMAGRRRGLAIEHEEGDFVPHEMAPLPGGAPQIFDIAASGLDDTLGEFAAAPAPLAAPAPVALDWANAAPHFPPAGATSPAPVPRSIEAQRQVFEAAAQALPAAIPALEVTLPVYQPEPDEGRQVFGMEAPLTPPSDRPRQIFGAPVTDDHVSREFVASQGFSTSVFDRPEPSSLFAERTPARSSPPEPAPQPEAMPVAAAIPEGFAPPVEIAPVAAVAEPAAIAPEPALPSPGSLGIEDLSARLAESMRRRRAARAGIAPEAPALAPVPQAFEPAPQSLLPEPEAVAPGGPTFTVPPFTVPPYAVPATELEQPLPAALRPLDLNGFEEDDFTASDSLLPPRRIALPVEPVPVAIVPPFAAAAEDEPEAIDEAAVAEDNYASLLEVVPSPASLSNPFVRVEEPEADATAIEPVVIFPGQAMPAPQPFARSAGAAAEEVVPFRRFDAPASAGQGQPSAANEAVSALPPEETERALRSALANLQRMSGAA